MKGTALYPWTARTCGPELCLYVPASVNAPAQEDSVPAPSLPAFMYPESLVLINTEGEPAQKATGRDVMKRQRASECRPGCHQTGAVLTGELEANMDQEAVGNIVLLAIITLISVVQNGFFAHKVEHESKTQNGRSFQRTGTLAFERVYTANQNCVDAYPTFLVVLWSAGLLCSQARQATYLGSESYCFCSSCLLLEYSTITSSSFSEVTSKTT